MKTFKTGDLVTCLHPVEAYDSNYGPNKGRIIQFQPGMIGTVHRTTCKVTIIKSHDPRYDQKEEFVVVDYIDENNQKQRVGLNFCNVKIITKYEIAARTAGFTIKQFRNEQKIARHESDGMYVANDNGWRYACEDSKIPVS